MFSMCLKGLKKVAGLLQLGNPALRAPMTISSPTDAEKLLDLTPLAPGHFVWQLKNVLCSGLYGGAIINAKNQVYSRFTFFPWGKELHPCLSLPYLGRNVGGVEKAVFLFTPDAKGNYYHWITDLLPRLILLLKANLKDFHERSIILHHPGRCYEKDTFALLDLSAQKLVRLKNFEVVAVKDLLLVDFIKAGRAFPEWKKTLLQELAKKLPMQECPIQEGSSIYLRRGKQAKRCLIGEEKLVMLLQERGFAILDTGSMSFTEQIAALSAAGMVVALHGAALANIIFCRPETFILELRSREQAPEHYAEVAKTCQLHFDSISLRPERINKKKHRANKANLLLSEESIESLLAKVESRAYAPSAM